MKEFKVKTFAVVCVEATVCAEDRAGAIAKAKNHLISGEIEPDEMTVERASSWAHPTGCACNLQDNSTMKTMGNLTQKDASESSFSDKTRMELSPAVLEMLNDILGEV